MNLNQIINMVVRMVMRQIVGRGVNAGINMASKKMSKSGDGTDAAPGQSAEGRDMAARAKQTMKATRRMGRF